MGGFQPIEKRGHRGEHAGKIDAHLTAMLEAVEWGEFELGNLFEIQNNPQLNKDSFVFSEKGTYPYFTRTVFNNGILGNVEYLDEDHKIKGNCLAVGMIALQFFYMKNDFYAGQFTKRAIPKGFTLTERTANYLIATLNKKQKFFQSILVRNFENIFKSEKIQLPTKNSQPDFKFMENFMAELEARHMAELEAYLSAAGLKDTTLSASELRALDGWSRTRWAEFKIGKLFEKPSLRFLKSQFNKNSDVSRERSDEFNLPLVNAKDGENGVMYYGRASDFEAMEMTIDIVKNGAVAAGNVYPQPQLTSVHPYNDAYLIRHKGYINREHLLFFTTSIYKSIKKKFSYEFKANWERVQEEHICLPEKDGQPDYSYMQLLLSAVQKLVIREVVAYADQKIAATQKVLKRHAI